MRKDLLKQSFIRGTQKALMLSLIILMSSAGFQSVLAQKWLGNTNSTDPNWRTGNVRIGGNGGTQSGVKLQVEGGNFLLNSATGSLDIRHFGTNDGWSFSTIGGGETLQLFADPAVGDNIRRLTISQDGDFSFTGKIGIGTGFNDVQYPFQIDDNATVGFQYNGSSSGFAGTYMNGALPFYGYKQEGTIQAYHYLDRSQNFRMWLDGSEKMVLTSTGQLGIGISEPERPIHLRATNAIFRIDRDRDDPGFAVVRYDQGFNNVWKSFYFYTRAFGPNNGKFIIADWEQNVAGPSTARLVVANNGNVGIGDFLFSNPSQKLTVAGNAQAVNFFTSSDKRLKEDIQPLTKALKSLNKVNGVHYAFRNGEAAFAKRNLPEGRSIGLIAQEVNKVYPELVVEDEEGYLSINYDGFIPVLIEAVKAQQNTIEAQNALIKSQEDRLTQIENKLQNLAVSNPSQQITPSNSAKLYQNQPNPFEENTKISFFLPQATQQAVLFVYDLQGKQIQRLRISQRGEGQVELQAGTLDAGMYFYSLMADGQEVDMKRMMITE